MEIAEIKKSLNDYSKGIFISNDCLEELFECLDELTVFRRLYPDYEPFKPYKLEWNSDKTYSWPVCPSPTCGRAIEKEYKFCPYCGQGIKW